MVIVSVQVFEEVSTLLGEDHQGEIQLSTSSSAIRIIRTQLGEWFSQSVVAHVPPPCRFAVVASRFRLLRILRIVRLLRFIQALLRESDGTQ